MGASYINKMFKILLIIVIIVIILELSFEIYEFATLCGIFSEKFHGNKYAELVRQIQNIECGVKPEIPIKKYLYYKNEIVGAISGDILILKGSSTILDCIKDLTLKKEDIKGIGKVQYGTKTMVDELIPQIDGYTINHITGWSLGAMIGLQISLHLYDMTGKKTQNVFFGLPPCVDIEYKHYYNSRLYHNTKVYNNSRDPIAYPLFGNNIFSTLFYNKLWGYHHVGKIYSNYPYTNYERTSFLSVASHHLSYF